MTITKENHDQLMQGKKYDAIIFSSPSNTFLQKVYLLNLVSYLQEYGNVSLANHSLYKEGIFSMLIARGVISRAPIKNKDVRPAIIILDNSRFANQALKMAHSRKTTTLICFLQYSDQPHDLPPVGLRPDIVFYYHTPLPYAELINSEFLPIPCIINFPNKLIVRSKRPARNKVCLFYPSDDYGIHFLAGLIKVANKLVKHDFTLVTTTKTAAAVKSLANDHIKLVPWNKIDQPITADMIITCDLFATIAADQKIPVIIAGPKGYGSLVEKANCMIHLKHHFLGRPGGYLMEYIPGSLLEMDIAVTLLNPGKMTFPGKSRLKVLHSFSMMLQKTTDHLFKIKERFRKTPFAFYARTKKGIQVTSLQDKGFLIIDHLNAFKGVITADEYQLMQKAQSTPIKDLANDQYSTKEVLGFFDSLENKNIVEYHIK